MEHGEFDIEEIGFGPVYIAGGEHKGEIGYCDDYDGKRAIIYFDVPFISEYTFVHKKYLRPVECAGPEKIAAYADKERMWTELYSNGDAPREPIDPTSAEWKAIVSKIVSPYDTLFKNEAKSRNTTPEK